MIKYTVPLIILILIGGCTKKGGVPGKDFTISLSSDRAYAKVLDTFTRLNLDLDAADNQNFDAWTRWKDCPTSELFQYGKFDDDASRFSRGRYLYHVSVSTVGEKTTMKIAVQLAGLLADQPHEPSGAAAPPVWKPGESNGKLEQTLFGEISRP